MGPLLDHPLLDGLRSTLRHHAREHAAAHRRIDAPGNGPESKCEKKVDVHAGKRRKGIKNGREARSNPEASNQAPRREVSHRLLSEANVAPAS